MRVDYALRLDLHSTSDDNGNLPLFEGFGVTKIESAEPAVDIVVIDHEQGGEF